VISPEGCASILWKSAEYAQDAAEAMGITAPRLMELGLVDQLIAEPAGGAHRNPKEAAGILKYALIAQVEALITQDINQVIENRYQKFRAIGRN
jgi:acetyl-CoA carboxylase carboxyl transferase subunit alpha